MNIRAERTPAQNSRAPHLPLATRRELVLDAALRVMLREDGTVSMEDVAAEAGVAKTVLYRCFDNREAMLEALDQRERQRLSRELTAVLESVPTGTDPVRTLHGFLQAYFTAVAGAPDSYRLVYGPSAQANRGIGVRRARAEATRHLTSVLSPWLDHADGGSAPGGERTAAAAAALAVGVAEAGARMLLDTGRHWTPAELARLAARLFAGGVPALAEDPQD